MRPQFLAVVECALLSVRKGLSNLLAKLPVRHNLLQLILVDLKVLCLSIACEVEGIACCCVCCSRLGRFILVSSLFWFCCIMRCCTALTGSFLRLLLVTKDLRCQMHFWCCHSERWFPSKRCSLLVRGDIVGCCSGCAENIFSAETMAVYLKRCSGSGKDEGVCPASFLMHQFVHALGWPLQTPKAPLMCKHCHVHLPAGVAGPLCAQLCANFEHQCFCTGSPLYHR